MLRPCRRRCFLRIALLVVVALGMVLQPLWAALGELHQAEHAVAVHVDHGHSHHDVDPPPTDADAAPGDPVGIHDLLHHAGAPASAALPASDLLPPGIAASGDPPQRPEPSAPPSSRLTLPFRPPIA